MVSVLEFCVSWLCILGLSGSIVSFEFCFSALAVIDLALAWVGRRTTDSIGCNEAI